MFWKKHRPRCFWRCLKQAETSCSRCILAMFLLTILNELKNCSKFFKICDKLWHQRVYFNNLLTKILAWQAILYQRGIVGPGLKHRVEHRTFCLTMRCFSDVLKKTLTSMFLTMFEKNPKHCINDASNDVNRPPLAVHGCSRLYLTVSGCTWMYLALPWSAKIYLSTDWHILPLTGVNTFVYTGLNTQRLHVAGMGRVGWKSLSAPIVRAPLSSANKETRWRGNGNLFFHSSSNNTTYCHRKLSKLDQNFVCRNCIRWRISQILQILDLNWAHRHQAPGHQTLGQQASWEI